MAGIFGGAKTNAASTPKYTQMGVQTSVYGLPIPIVFGTTRISINLGWYQNFHGVTVNNPSQGGGKGGAVGGGGKGGGAGGTTNYYADVIALMCEGPISGVPNSWISQTLEAGTPSFDVFTGAYGQGIWAYLEDNYPSQAIGYSGIGYLAGANYPFGTSANLPNINAEVVAFFAGSAPSAYGGNGCSVGGDADASLVVPEILTNTHWGIGFPSGRVGDVLNNSEIYTIPDSPYKITVANSTGFLFNLDVVNSVGTLYRPTASSPTRVRQYSFANGVYTFNAGAIGDTITINYASLTTLVNYQDFTLASGLWIAPAYVEQNAVSSMLDDIATATYSEFVWSSGILSVVPRGAQQVLGNGYVYNPPGTPAFNLGPDDFMSNGNAIGSNAGSISDPVIVSRKRKSDQINNIKIECLDRANQYAPAIAEASDQALIDQYGRRASASKSLHLFADVGAANVSAQLQLQDQAILNDYGFTLDQRYCMLDPMDIVTLTEPAYPGLTAIPVRITEIQENDDGSLSFSSEEYPGTIGSVPAYNLNIGTGYTPNFNQSAGVVNTPILLGAPVQIATNQGLEIWAALSGTNPATYGGSDVWVASDEGGPYRYLGRLTGASRMGVTTADFPVGTDPDTSNTLSVNLMQSAGQLDSGTQYDADQNNTLCYVDGPHGVEYVSYETAQLTSQYQYTLETYIRRGQYGSQIVDHPLGSSFLRLDQLIYRIPYQSPQIGQTMWFKFPTFNIWGGGLQNLSDATAYSIVLPAPPPPADVTGFTAKQVGGSVTFTWVDVLDFASAGYDIKYGPQGIVESLGEEPAWNAMLPLTDTLRSTEMTNASVPPGTWTFAIRCRDIANQLSPHLTTVDLVVTDENLTLVDDEQAPAWAGFGYGLKCASTGTALTRTGVSFAGDFTMAGWAKLRATQSGAATNGVLLAVETAATRGFRFGFKQNNKPAAWTTESGGNISIAASADVLIHKIFSWAIRWEAGSTTLSLLINGTTAASSTGTLIAPNNDELYVGSPAVAPCACELDNVTIWDAAIPDGDIETYQTDLELPDVFTYPPWALYGLDGNGLDQTSQHPLTATPVGTAAWTRGFWHGFVLDEVRGVLHPQSTKLASEMTNAELFEQYVPFPVPTAVYTSEIIDIGFDDTLRVFATQSATDGRGVTGSPTLGLLIDSWLTSFTDTEDFVPWTVASLHFRFMRARLQMTIGGSPAYLTSFVPTVDRPEPVQQQGTNVTAAPTTGTLVVFPEPFHQTPAVTPTATSIGATSATAVNVTPTGFELHVWTGALDTGGVANWIATGD
jgi:hypothetical protein